MAAARSDWRGAVLVEVQGFEVPIQLAFFKRVARPKPESFRTLDPKHLRPCRKPFVDIDGKEVPTGETLKGVEGAPGQFRVLGEESLALIERSTRSEACPIASFADSDTVPLELALESFHVRPDEKSANSQSSYVTFWSMLSGSDVCAVVQAWSPRAGSRPSILVLRATEDGIVAYVMPYSYEVKRAPTELGVQPSAKAAQLGKKVIEAYEHGPFDFSAFEDTYMQKRQAAIELALSGVAPPAELTAVEDTSGAPDLLAALEGLGEEPAEKPVKKVSKKAKSESEVPA